jgi:transcriptional regulator GlxA family with amidase domain
VSASTSSTTSKSSTHGEDFDALRAFVPEANVVEDSRWVDEGRIITSAGISARIEMCLHLVLRIESEDLAAATAKQMDYRWLADA